MTSEKSSKDDSAEPCANCGHKKSKHLNCGICCWYHPTKDIECKCKEFIPQKETCANCGHEAKYHLIDLDTDNLYRDCGVPSCPCEKFKSKSEICECGHEECLHGFKERPCQIQGCPCKKFIPQKETNVQRFGDAILISPKPQNHSSKGRHNRQRMRESRSPKDKELEEIKTETQVVNDRLNSSGLDNQIPHKHPRIDGSDNASSLRDKINERLDGDIVIRVEDVKESVQKLKDEMNKWKKIIGKTRDEMEIGYKDALTNVEDEIDKIFGSALI